MITVSNTIASVLANYTATQSICAELGTTLTFGTNMFINLEPEMDDDSLTIISYGGGSPNNDTHRQNPAIQLRLKTNSNRRAETTQQALINTLHMHKLGGKGLMQAVQSAPIILGRPESGEKIVSVSNYNVKYIKS